MNKIYKASIFAVIVLAGVSYCATSFAAVAPVANAGPDLYITSGQTITLQGSATDANGSSLTYAWNCDGGTLSAYNITQPTYTAPLSYGAVTYTCTFLVTNAYNLSNSDNTKIYVNSGVGGYNVQTNSATNIANNQATLNGYLSNSGFNGTVWFQWGTTSSYGSQTSPQSQNDAGNFTQNISGLAASTTYHFRAVGQNSNGTIYGQDMTFYTSNNSTSGSLLVNKKIINLSSGNLNWSNSIGANPSDLLSFAITLQASGQDIHNIIVTDILPSTLIYKGNLMVNASLNNSGNPTTGINIGTITSGQVAIIAFQAQVAPASNFVYGTTTLTNNASVSSTEIGSQSVSASIIVNNTYVSGVTNLPTGLTNRFFTESFLLPMFLIILGSWLYFSGNVYKFADWLDFQMNRR